MLPSNSLPSEFEECLHLHNTWAIVWIARINFLCWICFYVRCFWMPRARMCVVINLSLNFRLLSTLHRKQFQNSIIIFHYRFMCFRAPDLTFTWFWCARPMGTPIIWGNVHCFIGTLRFIYPIITVNSVQRFTVHHFIYMFVWKFLIEKVESIDCLNFDRRMILG